MIFVTTQILVITKNCIRNRQNFEATDSNTISKPFEGVKLRFEYDHIAPSGFGDVDQEYRQLCSLWFEYDPCLNRKPPNDLKSCLATLI